MAHRTGKFQKGTINNPLGRPKDPPELHALKTMSYGEFKLLLHKMLQAPPETLTEYRGTILEATLASIVYQCQKTGDPSRLEFFINRLYGKVPDKVELTEHEKVKSLSDEELLDAAVKAVEALKLKLQGKAK